ncbi:F17a-G fimbrial adhesin [compost metagenome]
MGMTDASTPGNTSDILTLSSDSKAKGVGIKILRDGVTPVMFTPDASVAGGPNQWRVGQFGNVGVDIPFTAYYVPTGGPITGGTANAAATYTISYQ